MSFPRQTLRDIIATREMGFSRNINICRGIELANKLKDNNKIKIINQPQRHYIDINFVLIKTDYNYIKVFLYRDEIDIYMYNNKKQFVSNIREYYDYRCPDDIQDVISIIDKLI
tara:strand:+ start:1269 stop:1610 length:342 start_codon:yes stop_codon:yes gene_type:complete